MDANREQLDVRGVDGEFRVYANGVALREVYASAAEAHSALRERRKHLAVRRAAAVYAVFDSASVDEGWWRLNLRDADPATRRWLESGGMRHLMRGVVRNGCFHEFDRAEALV